MPALSSFGGLSAIGRGQRSGGRKLVQIVLSSNTNNYTLNTSKIAGYEAGNTDVELTINSGVTVGSISTSSYALDIDTSWNALDTVKVINNGSVIGCAGAGGLSTFPTDTSGGTGKSGGPAFRNQRVATFINSGLILGGGGGGFNDGMTGGAGGISVSAGAALTFTNSGTVSGGGGGGGGGGADDNYASPHYAGGNGGGGTGYGNKGANQSNLWGGTITSPDATNGTNATYGSGGSAGENGGAGGNGGAYGSAGSTGGNGTAGRFGASGGAGGYCTTGKANINGGGGITGTTYGTQT